MHTNIATNKIKICVEKKCDRDRLGLLNLWPSPGLPSPVSIGWQVLKKAELVCRNRPSTGQSSYLEHRVPSCSFHQSSVSRLQKCGTTEMERECENRSMYCSQLWCCSSLEGQMKARMEDTPEIYGISSLSQSFAKLNSGAKMHTYVRDYDKHWNHSFALKNSTWNFQEFTAIHLG